MSSIHEWVFPIEQKQLLKTVETVGTNEVTAPQPTVKKPQERNELVSSMEPITVGGVDLPPAPASPPWRIAYCSSDELRAHLERKNADARPPLPGDMVVTGLPSLAAALEVQKSLAQYKTRCGRGDDGFYVRGDCHA